jgi:carbon-monoxide dehydrogenase medium subunit
VTGLANKAYRAENVEAALMGTGGSEADIAKAASLVAEGVDANSDLHASAEYRRHMAVVYCARAIRAALARTA